MIPRTRPREIWTRLTVDPLADPLARRLARLPGVTPNRVTGVALLLACAAATCFAMGALRVGGALFLLRFFADCLDGKVAREQGSSSAGGAALDITVDVVGITLCAGALSWHLVGAGHLPPAAAIGLLGSLVVYTFVLGHRKHLAALAGVGDGGSDHRWRVTRQPLRWWAETAARLNMSVLPWAVEAEIAAFGLAPLLLPARLVAVALGVALAFYLVANAVNLRRVLLITRLLDHPSEKRTPA
jgi:phosphatidylglycerophosphate synthase